MKDRGHENKLIYIASVIMTIAMLFSLSSGNKLLILLAYALLAIGPFRLEFLIPTYFSFLSSNYFVAIQGVGINRLMAFIIIFWCYNKDFKARKKSFCNKMDHGCIFFHCHG